MAPTIFLIHCDFKSCFFENRLNVYKVNMLLDICQILYLRVNLQEVHDNSILLSYIYMYIYIRTVLIIGCFHLF